MINALGHLMPDHDNTAAFDFVKPYEQPVKIGGQAACRKCFPGCKCQACVQSG